MTEDKKVEIETLLIFGMIGAVGLILLIGYATHGPTADAQVETSGGVGAIVTPMACDLMVVEGRSLMFCDGVEGELRPFEATPTPQP